MTIGNFDGCHKGHQALIAKSLRMAIETGTQSLALSFSPRPSVFFKPETGSPTLFTDAQKVRALFELGFQHVILQKFNQEFSVLSPEEFYSIVVKDHLHAAYIAVGQDFCFGKGRTGHAPWLKSRAAQDNIFVDIGDDVYEGDSRISSTQIRAAISQLGDAELATRLLGRPYMLEGIIEKGDQLGRTWGFPTANLGQLEQLIPLGGVYAGWVWLGDSPMPGRLFPPVMGLPEDKIPAVFSIGTRPTLNLSEPTLRIEAHLLSGNYGNDRLYGMKAGYYLSHHIRPNMKFPNFEALKEQIRADADQARTILSRT